MFKRLVKRMFVLPAVAAVCWGGTAVQGAESSLPGRVLKHSSPDGQSYSAVVLRASELPKGIIARDHIIVIDTSASQIGEHRQQSLPMRVPKYPRH